MWSYYYLGEDVASDEEVPELPEDPEVDRETSEVDLLSKFSRFTIKNPALCDPNQPTNFTHISSLPMEVLSDILKWVVSSELDLRSLENFSQVCRGFFVASRASNIWRLVCVKTWGVAGIPLEEPGMGGWRELYLSRPRVNLNGCYISRVSYLREGERGFQDNEFYKSWHVVHYHRILRFFAGGRVVMVTTSEDPSMAVKLLNSRYRYTITILNALFEKIH
jgi:F-box protein 9